MKFNLRFELSIFSKKDNYTIFHITVKHYSRQESVTCASTIPGDVFLSCFNVGVPCENSNVKIQTWCHNDKPSIQCATLLPIYLLNHIGYHFLRKNFQIIDT